MSASLESPALAGFSDHWIGVTVSAPQTASPPSRGPAPGGSMPGATVRRVSAPREVRAAGFGQFTAVQMRVYYPSLRSGPRAKPLPGRYPLVLFAHGQRDASSGLCPEDRSLDFQRWGGLLHLLARCGMVVASVRMVHPASHNPVDSDRAALRLEEAYRYLLNEWEHRDIIARGIRDEHGIADHRNTRLGVIGHSWGMGGCARAAVRGNVPVAAIASVAGTWESHIARDLLDARAPTLHVWGTEDTGAAALYRGQVPPKHAAVLLGAGHWDWFDSDGLRPCSGESSNPCPASYEMASELLTVFFHRYLLLRADLDPRLLLLSRRWRLGWPPRRTYHDSAGRPDLTGRFLRQGSCGLALHWAVDGSSGEYTLRMPSGSGI